MATVEAGPRPLTARQREVLEFIYQCVRERGYQPSIRDVAERFGLPRRAGAGAVCHLRALQRKGYIAVRRGRGRSLDLFHLPSGEPFRGFVEVRDG